MRLSIVWHFHHWRENLWSNLSLVCNHFGAILLIFFFYEIAIKCIEHTCRLRKIQNPYWCNMQTFWDNKPLFHQLTFVTRPNAQRCMSLTILNIFIFSNSIHFFSRISFQCQNVEIYGYIFHILNHSKIQTNLSILNAHVRFTAIILMLVIQSESLSLLTFEMYRRPKKYIILKRSTSIFIANVRHSNDSVSTESSTAIRLCALIYTVRIEHCYPIISKTSEQHRKKKIWISIASERKVLLIGDAHCRCSSFRHYFQLVFSPFWKRKSQFTHRFGLFLVNF